MAKELTEKLVKVDILRSCYCRGVLLEVGKTKKIPASEADTLVKMGKVTLAGDKTEATSEQTLDNDPKSISDNEKLAAVIEAIGMLDEKDETHFTKDGKPDANTLTSLVGFQVSAALRDEAFAATQTEAAAKPATEDTTQRGSGGEVLAGVDGNGKKASSKKGQ